MSRSKHRQHGGVRQWNPPKPEGSAQLAPGVSSVVSATECTGLVAQPATDEEAAQSYARLGGIHTQKTQGNIGKGNPNNDPYEREFHRT